MKSHSKIMLWCLASFIQCNVFEIYLFKWMYACCYLLMNTTLYKYTAMYLFTVNGHLDFSLMEELIYILYMSFSGNTVCFS